MLSNTLYRMAGSPDINAELTLPPDAVNGWYGSAVEWALANGVMEAYWDGSFGPENPVTREQLAGALWRYAKQKGMDTGKGQSPGVYNYADVFAVSEDLRDAFDWACSNGIIKGTDNGTLLKPQAGATRAETAAVLKRFAEN
jgi:hypothetical protein